MRVSKREGMWEKWWYICDCLRGNDDNMFVFMCFTNVRVCPSLILQPLPSHFCVSNWWGAQMTLAQMAQTFQQEIILCVHWRKCDDHWRSNCSLKKLESCMMYILGGWFSIQFNSIYKYYINAYCLFQVFVFKVIYLWCMVEWGWVGNLWIDSPFPPSVQTHTGLG